MKEKRVINLSFGFLFFYLISSACALAGAAQYTYDNLNRLKKVYFVDTGVTIEYTYDAVGNRMSRQVTAPSGSSYSSSSAVESGPGAPAAAPVVRETPGTPRRLITGGAMVTPGLSDCLSRITAAGSPGEAEIFGREFLDSLDQADLSPEDKEQYRQQVARALEARTASLKEEAGQKEAGGVEKTPAAADQDGGRGLPADKKTAKIRREGGRIYTVPAAPGDAQGAAR